MELREGSDSPLLQIVYLEKPSKKSNQKKPKTTPTRANNNEIPDKIKATGKPDNRDMKTKTRNRTTISIYFVSFSLFIA